LQCPKRWVTAYPTDDGPGYYEPPESEAKRFGELVDCLFLTPSQFHHRYAVVPAEAPKRPTSAQLMAKKPSEETQKAIAWWAQFEKDSDGKTIVKQDEYSAANACVDALVSDEFISLLRNSCDTQVWVEAEYVTESGIAVPVRGLIDMLPREDSDLVAVAPIYAKMALDLKTTRDASLRGWARFALAVGYHVQAAIYLDLLRAALPEREFTSFGFILVENFPPHTIGKRLMEDDSIEGKGAINSGRRIYQNALELYARCLKTGRWPSYDDTDISLAGGWTVVQPDPYQEMGAQFAPKFVAEEEAGAESEPVAEPVGEDLSV
jgi:exodeoxyribonuclease VIII